MKKNTNNTETRTVKGYSNYLVDSEGVITSLITGKEVKRFKKGGSKKHGYYYAVALINDSNVTNFEYVHRVVAETFLPNPENKKFVAFREREFDNCNVENLFWATAKEANQYARKVGKVALSNFETPLDMVFKIRFDFEQLGYTHSELAVKYNRPTTSIKHINRYITFNDEETIMLQRQVFNTLLTEMFI